MPAPLGSVRRDGETDDFLEWARSGRFLLRRCRRCGVFRGPQEALCPGCDSPDSEAAEASGGARVISWSVVHGRDPDGTYGPQAVVAIGELDEGPWWWTQVIDAGPSDLTTGRRLTVMFQAADGGETLPVFRLG